MWSKIIFSTTYTHVCYCNIPRYLSDFPRSHILQRELNNFSDQLITESLLSKSYTINIYSDGKKRLLSLDLVWKLKVYFVRKTRKREKKRRRERETCRKWNSEWAEKVRKFCCEGDSTSLSRARNRYKLKVFLFGMLRSLPSNPTAFLFFSPFSDECFKKFFQLTTWPWISSTHSETLQKRQNLGAAHGRLR